MKNRKRDRKTIGKTVRQSPPKIFVLIETTGERSWYKPTHYAQAHIRVKSGKYVYLEWRDGESIRSLYLGTRRAKK